MNLVKVLSAVYLYSLAASTIASILNIDVQLLLRLPLFNLRYIDIAILAIFVFFVFKCLPSYNLQNRTTKIIINLSVVYVIFEFFQLVRSFGAIDMQSQISWFITSLSIFIIPYIMCLKIKSNEIEKFFNWFLFYGVITIVFTKLYLLYSFYTGNAIVNTIQDEGIRIAGKTIGEKETISDVVLIPFVFLLSTYKALKTKNKFYVISVIVITVSVIFAFHRGFLITILSCTLYMIYLLSNSLSKIIKYGLVFLVIVVATFIIIPKDNKFNPYTQIEKLIEFSYDTDNPDWDKGRSIVRKYAISAWHDNLFIGVGYDSLANFGGPKDASTSHSFIITSLFHRGVIGTFILLLIIIIPYYSSLKIVVSKKSKKNYSNYMLRFLSFTILLWIIVFLTQEIIWEKYALSIEYMYFGFLMKWTQTKKYNTIKNEPVNFNNYSKLQL